MCCSLAGVTLKLDADTSFGYSGISVLAALKTTCDTNREKVRQIMFLGNHHLATFRDLSFSVRLNDDGFVDAPLAPDGMRYLDICYEHRGTDKAGFIPCRFDGDAVPSVCRDIDGFFEKNKEVLCDRALAAVRLA